MHRKKEKGILRRVFSRSPKPQIDNQAIRSNIDSLVREDQLAKDEMIAQESQLAVTSSRLKGKFYDLITKMENEVTSTINKKAESAGKVAGNTYFWLILLSVSGGLLAIMVLLIIIRYVRKAYAYQEALENSKAEAEKLARTKELFVANMSHEIRTPVTAISGFTEQLLKEQKDDNLNRSLNIIKSSSDHLLKIIDDILDFSKLENDKLILEKVDFSVGQIAQEVCSLFENQAKQNNTVLSYRIDEDAPSTLSGDPVRLKQILINLVSNSVKFTKNGTVNFSIRSADKIRDEIDLFIEVSDTGIGIDESKIDVIFEDFSQAEMSTSRKYGGTGLGLSIVKKLIELHNGTIDIKSRKNQGTTIVCRIPYRKGNEKNILADTGMKVSAPAELSGLKVLVVDDVEYNRLLFRKILESWNMLFNEASTGMDALELLKENKYDLLFMDMLMPGLDGLNTTKFIREEMKISSSDMPVIFISAATFNENSEKYRDAGIDAFLRKPFTEASLLATILETMGRWPPAPDENSNGLSSANPEGLGKIELGNLYRIAAGDEKFVKQMLISFEETTRNGLNSISAAITGEEWDTVADNAHRLMPPCRHIGAKDLFRLLYDIETNSRNRINTASIKLMFDNSLREFDLVSEILGRQIAKMA